MVEEDSNDWLTYNVRVLSSCHSLYQSSSLLTGCPRQSESSWSVERSCIRSSSHRNWPGNHRLHGHLPGPGPVLHILCLQEKEHKRGVPEQQVRSKWKLYVFPRKLTRHSEFWVAVVLNWSTLPVLMICQIGLFAVCLNFYLRLKRGATTCELKS